MILIDRLYGSAMKKYSTMGFAHLSYRNNFRILSNIRNLISSDQNFSIQKRRLLIIISLCNPYLIYERRSEQMFLNILSTLKWQCLKVVDKYFKEKLRSLKLLRSSKLFLTVGEALGEFYYSYTQYTQFFIFDITGSKLFYRFANIVRRLKSLQHI